MLKKGDWVVCLDDQLGFLPSLVIKKGNIYTVKEYISPEEYEKQNSSWLVQLTKEERGAWQDGAVLLEGVFGDDGSDLIWQARRFKPAE